MSPAREEEFTPEQRAAIECPDRDILVEAGAGTGKTKTTVGRYERLLGEFDPSKVLVFTFTDKAATELRERVRGLRERARKELDESGGDQDPGDGSVARLLMGSTWIGTFHSICARMLRSHPVAGDVDPGFDVIDEVRADRLKRRAWDLALNRTMEADGTDIDLSRFNGKHLREGLQHAFEQLRALGQSRPALPPPPPPRSPDLIHQDLLTAAASAAGTGRIQKRTREQIEELSAWLRATPAAQLTSGGVRAAFSSKSDKLGPLLTTINRAACDLAAAEFGDRIWGHLRNLLTQYGESYDELKRAGGYMDYEDLQLKTLAMLRRSEAVAAIYREQFQEIMVDEFQDTNQLQMDLINALRGENTTLFTVGDEMQAIYGFRFADVALFRNRRKGADRPVRTLPLSANFRSEPAVIGAVNEIGRQFEEIVAGIRTSAEPGGPAGGTGHEFAELRAGRAPSDGVRPGVEFLFTARGKWSGTDLGDLYQPPEPGDDGEAPQVGTSDGQHEAEALAVAARIRGMIEDEKVDPGQIVILFRSRTRIWMFEQALKQLGIRPYVVGGSRFWESREGVDLRSLLAVIANPLDDESLIGSLAGATCGLSADALWTIARDREGRPIWTRLREYAEAAGDDRSDGSEDRRRAARFVTTIESLRRKINTTPLGRLVEEAVTRTGYDLVNLRRDPSGAGLANIRHVSDIADGFEAAEGRDLRRLVDWIDASAELDSEAAVATADEDADVVRLMTCHKSKGLQFDVVFLADLGKQTTSQSEQVVWISPGTDPDEIEFGLRIPEPDSSNTDLYAWTGLQDRARLNDTDEELRILHVAMTRAKRRLVLSGLADLEGSPNQSESSSMADRLTDAFGIDATEPAAITVAGPGRTGPEAVWPDSSIELRRVGPEQAGELTRVLRSHPAPPATREEVSPPLARPRSTVLPEVPLSYSALAGYKDCPARFYATRILRLRDPAAAAGGTVEGIKAEILADETASGAVDPESRLPTRPDASRFGNAVHLLLERMAARRWRLPAKGEIVSVLRSEGAATDDDSMSRAAAMIKGFTESRFAAGLGETGLEAERTMLVETGGVMIRGYVDLVAAASDPVTVVDYKTNRLDGATPGEKMGPYELQRDLYALGVARARDVELVRTAFVFLEAPDDPVIDLYDREMLTEAATRVETVVGEIAGSNFLGGRDALHEPCGKCWACDLLADRIGLPAGA